MIATPAAFSNAAAMSVITARRLPAACSFTAVCAMAGLTVRKRVVASRSVRTVEVSLALIVVGEEELLPFNLVVRNNLLPLGGRNPVDEGHAVVLLHVGPFGRVHQHDDVLVEQLGVVLHGDDEVL